MAKVELKQPIVEEIINNVKDAEKVKKGIDTRGKV